jgi:hypothetical protein
MPRSPDVVATVVLAALFAGTTMASCGSRTDPLLDELADGATPGEAGASPQDSSTAPLDAGGPDTSPLVDASPQNTGVMAFVNSGVIFAQQGLTGFQSTFWAEFDLGATDSGCSTTQAGACSYLSCPAGYVMEPFDLPSGDAVGAGSLSLGGGELDAGVALPFDAAYLGYNYFPGFPPFFMPGDRLTVSASGGVVPAFTAPPIEAPGMVSLDAPRLTSGGYYAVSVSSDLTVQWSGGQADAQFVLQGGAGDSSFFQCTWGAALGQGTVPSSVLMPFAPSRTGTTGLNGQMIAMQQRGTTFAAGSFSVQEWVIQYGVGAQVAFY